MLNRSWMRFTSLSQQGKNFVYHMRFCLRCSGTFTHGVFCCFIDLSVSQRCSFVCEVAFQLSQVHTFPLLLRMLHSFIRSIRASCPYRFPARFLRYSWLYQKLSLWCLFCVDSLKFRPHPLSLLISCRQCVLKYCPSRCSFDKHRGLFIFFRKRHP